MLGIYYGGRSIQLHSTLEDGTTVFDFVKCMNSDSAPMKENERKEQIV